MICGRAVRHWTGPGGSSPEPRSGTEAVEGGERGREEGGERGREEGVSGCRDGRREAAGQRDR